MIEHLNKEGVIELVADLKGYSLDKLQKTQASAAEAEAEATAAASSASAAEASAAAAEAGNNEWNNTYKPQVIADHEQASTDHTQALADSSQAASDHTQAEADSSTAGSDHTQAGNDHTQAEADHAQADTDHTQAGTDHATAEADHTQAEADHGNAVLTTADQGLTEEQQANARTNIEAAKASDVTDLALKTSNITELVNYTFDGNSMDYLPVDIHAGDYYHIKVTNATIGKAVSIGVIDEQGSGYKEKFFELSDSNSYDLYVTCNVDSYYFKLYDASMASTVVIEKIQYLSELYKDVEAINTNFEKIFEHKGGITRWNVKLRTGNRYRVTFDNTDFTVESLIKTATIQGVYINDHEWYFNTKVSKDINPLKKTLEFEAIQEDNVIYLHTDFNQTVNISIIDITNDNTTKASSASFGINNSFNAITSIVSNASSEELSVKVEANKVYHAAVNIPVGSSLVLGSIEKSGDSGFTEIFTEINTATKELYDFYFCAFQDAECFKLYSDTDSATVIIEEMIPNVERLGRLESILYDSTLVKTIIADKETVYVDYSIKVSDRFLIKVSNLDKGGYFYAGAVNEGQTTGLAQQAYGTSNVANETVEFLFEADSDYPQFKFTSKDSNFNIEIYSISEKQTLFLQDVVQYNRVISTTNSLFDCEIKSGEVYKCILTNTTADNPVKIGSVLTTTDTGFDELFIDETLPIGTKEYTLDATVDADRFKCWAKNNGVTITIYRSNINLKDYIPLNGSYSGGSIGYVNIGYNTDGAKNNYCVAIGSNTLSNNTGIKNISIGNDNMHETTGHDNTSMGYHASFRNTSGYYNAAFGAESQDDNTTGTNNTSIGFCSLQRNNTGSNNVAVGYFALDGYYDNRFDAENPKEFNRNVAVGAFSMKDVSVDSNENVAIGYNTLTSAKKYVNCIAIGSNVNCDKDNQMVLGNSSITEVVVMGNKKLIFNDDGTVTWEALS